MKKAFGADRALMKIIKDKECGCIWYRMSLEQFREFRKLSKQVRFPIDDLIRYAIEGYLEKYGRKIAVDQPISKRDIGVRKSCPHDAFHPKARQGINV
jgi:hypothetical protein